MRATNGHVPNALALLVEHLGKRIERNSNMFIVLPPCRETVWGVLTGQLSECTSNLVAHEVKEIETWMLRLLSAPVSIPGKTKILVRTNENERYYRLSLSIVCLD
jgi:hypothetical protein